MTTRNEYSLFKRKRKSGIVWYFYYWDGDRRVMKSTKASLKKDAIEFVTEFLAKRNRILRDLTFREYADPYFVWESCPHIRRLRDEKKSITKYHAQTERKRLENHVFTDPIADLPVAEIKRRDLLDFRSRLLKTKTEATANKVMKAIKTIFKEAVFREELEKDPTIGIGMISRTPKEAGTFTAEELLTLFPRDGFGPWRDIHGYTCFLLAATTGMRRGEILALKWHHVDLANQLINIVEAWKNLNEVGKPKWEKTRTIPISRFTAKKLQAYFTIRTPEPDDLVFSYPNGKRFGGTWWQKRFRGAMNNAGIDYEGRNLKPHSFRHSLTTILREKGEDPAKIRAFFGWQEEKTQDGYTHWNTDHLRAQAEQIDGIFSA